MKDIIKTIFYSLFAGFILIVIVPLTIIFWTVLPEDFMEENMHYHRDCD